MEMQSTTRAAGDADLTAAAANDSSASSNSSSSSEDERTAAHRRRTSNTSEAGRNANSSDSDDDDDGYDSDAQITRIAESAASFARRCITTGEVAKALVALQSVIEVAQPPRAAYAQAVLLIAQLLQLAGRIDASLACMLDVFRFMPPPYTLDDGVRIIVRLYERTHAPALAAHWRKQLVATDDDEAALAAFADRSFAANDFVFALDAYTRVFARHTMRCCRCRRAVTDTDIDTYSHGSRESNARATFALSTTFLVRFMHSALHVRDPLSHVQSQRQTLAWTLVRVLLLPSNSNDRRPGVQCFQSNDSLYSDVSYYALRALYYRNFRTIYDAAFAWTDAPARVIATHWRVHWMRLVQQQSHSQQQQSQQRSMEATSGASASKALICTTTRRRQQQQTDTRAPVRVPVKTQTNGRRRQNESRPAAAAAKSQQKATSPSRSSSMSSKAMQHKRLVAAGNGGVSDGDSERSIALQASTSDALLLTNQSDVASAATASTRVRQQAMRRYNQRPFDPEPKQCEGYESSPTKRKLNAVRRLRKSSLVDDLTERSLHSTAAAASNSSNGDAADERDSDTRRSLLDVYALPVAPQSAFLAAVGRAPGFADLDLDALEQYARIAHYRARVLTQQHVDVAQLDAARVQPSWLQAFERAVAMVASLKQPPSAVAIGAPSPLPLEPTAPRSATHLTHVHARVVLQLTAVLQQYGQQHGETQFTRELRALVHRLSHWRVPNAVVLLQALDAVRTIGVREEKQRNLEFYHVYANESDAHGTNACHVGDSGIVTSEPRLE